MHVQRVLKMSRVFTLAEILSKIFVIKKRMKSGDLIYDHGFCRINDLVPTYFLLKHIMRSLLARRTYYHSENVEY